MITIPFWCVYLIAFYFFLKVVVLIIKLTTKDKLFKNITKLNLDLETKNGGKIKIRKDEEHMSINDVDL